MHNITLEKLKQLKAKVGSNVWIGSNVYMEKENACLLTIEDEVTISGYCKFIFHDSSLNNINNSPIQYGKIILKKSSYIGFDSLILPGSIIGKRTLVGAGSLVKGKLQDNSVYVGRPAKRVCSIDELLIKWKNKRNNQIKLVDIPKWHQRNKSDYKQLEEFIFNFGQISRDQY